METKCGGKVEKATNAIYACKKMLDKTWDISPRLIHWCYIAIARPILLYDAIVWWTAVRKKTYIKPMEKVQRTASLCITDALGTSPTDALHTILNLPPIYVYMEYVAAKSAARLTALGRFKFRTWGHSSIGLGQRHGTKTQHLQYIYRWL